MRHPHELAGDDLPGLAPGRSLALARLLSVVFSPPFTAILSWCLVLLMHTSDWASDIGWVVLTILVQIVPVGVLYFYRRHTGVYRDADVSVRHERNELYLYGSLSVLVSLLLLQLLGAPMPFRALALTTLILGIVCGLVNLVWKISMHAATIGTVATIAFFYAPALGLVLWVCALAVGWARIRTRNHSLLQVVAGLVVSTTIALVIFSTLL